jgi:hypothetical protein
MRIKGNRKNGKCWVLVYDHENQGCFVTLSNLHLTQNQFSIQHRKAKELASSPTKARMRRLVRSINNMYMLYKNKTFRQE